MSQIDKYKKQIENCINKKIPKKYRGIFWKLIIVIGFVYHIIMNLPILKDKKTIVSNSQVMQIGLNNNQTNNQVLPASTVEEKKIQETYINPCDTTNNFEPSIWDVTSMRVIEIDEEANIVNKYGTKSKNNYQSQMIYPFDCMLPLKIEIVVTSYGNESIGLTFEYSDVFQVIVGDGDRRTIRYKFNQHGSRITPWPYKRLVPDSPKIEHRIPNNDNIDVGSQINLYFLVKQSDKDISVQTSILYKSEKLSEYVNKPVVFDEVRFKVNSFNPTSSKGKKVRIGINDFRYEGKQAVIFFEKFSIKKVN